MSELHTYRIHLTTGTGGTTTTDESAFTADDALTQFRAAVRGDYSVFKIEPLPDADLGSEIRRLAVEHHARADAPRREWATIPVAGVNLTPPQVTARATTPQDRADALESALRERTAERDAALADRARVWSRLNEVAGVVTHAVPDDADLADDTAKIAMDMRKERNALIDAITGGGNLTMLRSGVKGVVDCATGHRDRIDVLQAERDTLKRMNEAGSSEVVAEMAKTRELKSERDALQKRIDAATAWLGPNGRVGLGAAQAELLAILEGREP